MWSHHHLLVVMEGPIHNRPPDQAGRDAIHADPLLRKLLWSTAPTGVTNGTQREKTYGQRGSASQREQTRAKDRP